MLMTTGTLIFASGKNNEYITMYFLEKLGGKGLYKGAWNIDSQQMLSELPPILHLNNNKNNKPIWHMFFNPKFSLIHASLPNY